MAHMFVRGTVEDFATFRNTFDDAEELRRSAGATESTVYQSVDNANEFTIRNEFPTADAAKAFASSQELRDAMQRAGLQGPPTIWFVNEI